MRAFLQRWAIGSRPAVPTRLGKSASPAKRLVWRIVEGSPQGAWVDPDTVPADTVSPPTTVYDNWTTSSMDLLDGAEVTEHGGLTTPAELYDALFGAHDAKKKDGEQH